MQKYSPISDETPAMREDSADGSWYWCQDVDARIDALERALKSCAALLLLDIREREKFLHAAKEAVREADKALTV